MEALIVLSCNCETSIFAKVRSKLEYLPSAAAALIVRKSIESRCVRCVAGGGTSQYFVTRLQSCGRREEAANYTKCPIISIITLLMLTNTQIYTVHTRG